MSSLMIPIPIFAMVVLIVGLAQFARIHSLETEVQGKLHALETEHMRKMQELNLMLQRAREGSQDQR
jgi:hypothetical protein